MPYFHFIWNDDIVAHLAEHDVSWEDFERVVSSPLKTGRSRSSGLPSAWGYTEDGRYIMAVYKELDDFSIVPVTAYEVPEPR